MICRNSFCVVLIAFVSSFALAEEKGEFSPVIFADAPRAVSVEWLWKLKIPFRPSESSVLRRKQVEKQLREGVASEELKMELETELARLREPNKLAMGLYLPRRRFRLSEPMPAYFVLKNVTKKPLPLDMRLDIQFRNDLSNSCFVDLRCTKVAEGYELKPDLSSRTWRCGGESLVTAPANGYYCVRGDLRNLGANVPGDYVVKWGGLGCVSNEIAFTVLPPDGDSPEHRPFTAAAIAMVGDDPEAIHELEELRKFEDVRPQPKIDPAYLTKLPFASMAAALSVGVDGVIYPDILNLPDSDKFITATARFNDPKSTKLPRNLVLTLKPKQHNKGLILNRPEHIYLLATSRTAQPETLERAREHLRADRLLEIEGYSLAEPTRPVEVSLNLTEDWPDQLGLTGWVELRVLICSERIKPQGRMELVEIMKELRRIDETPWEGLLCTPPIKLRLPDMNTISDG